jgi:hypothetical protein
MCLVFDCFPSMRDAEAFVAHVAARFGLGAQVYASQVESDRDDFFPSVLDPPIVLVDRLELDDVDAIVEAEERVGASVADFGGAWAGT